MKNKPPSTRTIITNNTPARILEIPFLFFNKKIKGGEDFVFILFTYGWAIVEEDTEIFALFSASAVITTEY